jgi:hypothetical protein
MSRRRTGLLLGFGVLVPRRETRIHHHVLDAAYETVAADANTA